MIKKNTISLETAKKWTQRWRQEESTYNKYHKCIAFNIPLVDLQQVLAEKSVASVRAYLGVDDNDVEKMIIVGVDANGKDMITFAKDSTLKGGDDNGGIFDFTEPCPISCDKTSPLYGL